MVAYTNMLSVYPSTDVRGAYDKFPDFFRMGI